MPGNPLVVARTHTVKLKVIPCEITASIIPNMTTSIGNKQDVVFPIFSYTNTESTL